MKIPKVGFSLRTESLYHGSCLVWAPNRSALIFVAICDMTEFYELINDEAM